MAPEDTSTTRSAQNPVLRGFAPDPSVVRVGGWFYLATSSFEWFPTIPVYRSQDLASWSYVGSVDTAVPERHLRGVPDSAGIWAPSISHDGNRFWITYAIVRTFHGRQLDVEVYVTTADDLESGWTEPHRVSGHGFDPALFHHDGKHYLLNLQSDSRPGGSRFSGIIITELTADGSAVVGRPTLLLQHEHLMEGPKLLHRDGMFYLVLAEGGTGAEHGVRIARSSSLYGPWELDAVPLLTSRDRPGLRLQKAGHGELFQSGDGRWFLSHLASRWLDTAHGRQFPWGRETCVQAVEWEQGWPRLVGGGWHPSDTFEVPAVGGPPEETVEVSERPWYSLRQTPAAWAEFDTAGESVTLRGRHDLESQFDVSLLARPLDGDRVRLSTVVDVHPTTYTESAGIVAWYNSSSYYSLAVTWSEPSGETQAGQQWSGTGRRVAVLTQRDATGTYPLRTHELPSSAPVPMSVSVSGASVQFHLHGAPFGPVLDVGILSDDYGPLLRFTGSMLGIFAVDTVNARLSATFTSTQLTDTSSEEPQS